MGLFLSISLVRSVYLPAGVATRRATKVSTNMCSSSLKKVCEVVYFYKLTNIRACKFYENSLFLQGFLQQFSKFILKKVYQFFSEKITEIC